jgi:glutamyl-tRNA synthetase
MLPSAVDDIEMGVTDVLRGEDHVSNTALQLQMFTALGAEPPSFAHEALLVGSEGKLSKRLGSLGCESFRERGIEPEALVARLGRLGTSEPVEPIAERAQLVETFELAHIGRAPARFDDAELERLNSAIVHQMDYSRAQHRLPEAMTEAGWLAIRPNLAHIGEAADWWSVVTGPVKVPPLSGEDRAYIGEAARALTWPEDPWHALTNTLKAATGRKGRDLFHPLRLALTGCDSGPDMKALLPLIGEQEARARLERAAGT